MIGLFAGGDTTILRSFSILHNWTSNALSIHDCPMLFSISFSK
jgi:hypothetical protein